MKVSNHIAAGMVGWLPLIFYGQVFVVREEKAGFNILTYFNWQKLIPKTNGFIRPPLSLSISVYRFIELFKSGIEL